MNFAEGFEAGVSPREIVLRGNAGENICGQVNISLSEEEYIFDLEGRYWEGVERRNINALGEKILKVYPEEVFISSPGSEVDFCVVYEKPGEYYGALLFGPKDSAVGVGVWIRAYIDGKNIEEERVMLNTNYVYERNGLMNLMIISLFSWMNLLAFLFLVFIRKKNSEKYEY